MDVFGVNLALRYPNSSAAMYGSGNDHHDNRMSAASSHITPASNPAVPLPEGSSSHAMFAQFHARYPMGSLTSELLNIHDGQYIVRASVQAGGVTLATGMAAAEVLEVAEDRARMRALEVLGIHPPQPHPGELKSSAYEVQVHLMTNHSSKADFTQAALGQASASMLPAAMRAEPQTFLAHEQVQQLPEQQTTLLPLEQPQAADVSYTGATLPAGDLLTHIYDEPEEEEFFVEASPVAEPQPVRQTPSPAKSASSKAAPSPTNGKVPHRTKGAPEETPLRPEPMDLSDAIAQTTIEIKRLGWTEVQGRKYLQQTYGKRSRQHLTDEELLEFLDYLRSQPSPNESPF